MTSELKRCGRAVGWSGQFTRASGTDEFQTVELAPVSPRVRSLEPSLLDSRTQSPGRCRVADGRAI